MNILVTGASGFVGQALCRDLERRGHAVRRALRGPVIAEDAVAVGEIGPATAWEPALSGIETIVHCAARVHVMADKAADPLAAFRAVNTEGTLVLARAARAAGVRRMVFLSSIKVNGEGTAPDCPYRETDAPAPVDPYGQSKWEAERELAAMAGLETVILRPPLIYGPGVKANFRALMQACRRGLPLPFGSLDNRRSLLFLGNLTDAIACCVEHPQAAGRTYLLGDGRDVSTPELIRLLAEALGTKPRLLPVPPALLNLAGALTGRRAAVARLLGSLTIDDGAIRRELGWSPPFTVEEGLRATVRS